MKKAHILVFLALIFGAVSCQQNDDSENGNQSSANLTGTGSVAYNVETIEMPEGLQAETGAIAFLPDGRLIATFRRGEVMIYDPESESWDLFAKGLQDPLGIHVVNQHEILVMQRPELTRIVDTDEDGLADLYETVTDDFGMSGNYAEFAFGPVVNSEGDYFIALMTASNQADVREILRGEFNPFGRPGRMYSAVPYRGWVMKVKPDGTTIPWAHGLRSPNGLMLDENDNLFITDNQGDWLGTSKMYHIEEGNFYGHAPSLAWVEGFDRQPLEVPVDTLDKWRTKEVINFPHSYYMNSPTQPVLVNANGNFGPFEGQILVGEMNVPRIGRVILEEVQGQFQGATVSLIDTGDLRNGNNRMVFSPEGDLWVGQTAQGWAGNLGIQKISWNGIVPMEILTMSLTETGFDLTFTKPVDPETASALSSYYFERYYYEYHQAYGSPRFDVEEVDVTGVELSEDRLTVSLELETLEPGYIYDLQITDITSQEDGSPIEHPRIFYTLNNLRD